MGRNDVDEVRSARPKGKKCRLINQENVEESVNLSFANNHRQELILLKKNKVSTDFMNNSG